MKYTTAVAAAFVAGATASYSPGWASAGGEGEGSGWAPSGEGEGWAVPTKSWVTEVMTAFTTFCPEATQITHGGTTYSVTEATTLTISGPATVSYPVTWSTTVSYSPPPPPPTSWAPPPSSSSAPPPPPPSSWVPPPPPMSTAPVSWSVPSNATVPVPTGTAPPVKTTPAGPVYTGAASALKAGSAGLAAVFGLVAYAL